MTRWAIMRIWDIPKACLPNSQGAERGGKASGFGEPAGGHNCGLGRTALHSQSQPGAVEEQCTGAGYPRLPAEAADTGPPGHCVCKV